MGLPVVFFFSCFATSRKKGSRLKLTTYKHESDKNKKYLSVDSFRILSIVVSSVSITYTSLCRGLKIPYSISNNLNAKLHDC